MRKQVKSGDHTYTLEKVGDKWEITSITYHSATERITIEVPEDAREILKIAMNQDEYRRKKESDIRKANVSGRKCTNYSKCDQCGECSRSPATFKQIRQSNPVDTILERRESRTELESIIGQLSPKQQVVIRQRYLADKKAVEISQSTGMSKSVISHMEKRALKKLKTFLQSNVNFLH
ncbi:MAG: sigma-70 family RNA polymerase sigma factor [Oscillospiraceae bacterium]|jgi:RNA polymerase sigma factor (sigma-70 family)|nr:sigma-70 family RNA polymerase sigma factor [Oscillospiraceae bacterium]